MIPGELPYCEFDRKSGQLVAIDNCASEADRDRVVKEHIEGNREQLKARSGLTNKKRSRLHKETDALSGTCFAPRKRDVERRDKLRFTVCQKSPTKSAANAASLKMAKAKAKRGISGG
jgi:hypothetical protein